MENIVSVPLTIKIFNEVKSENISMESAEKLLLEMEEELKDVLFDGKQMDDRYKDKVKTEYIEWVKKDPVYPDAVKKYIEDRVAKDVVQRVPYIVATLLVKYVIEKT